MRFPGFEGDWKNVTIGECSSTLDYGMNSAAIKFDGENKYIRITDIDDESRKYKFNSPVSPEGILLDKYLVKENDILFVRTGADTGRSYLYRSFDGKLYFAGFLIRARIKASYNGNFIFAQTLTQKYNKWVKLMSMRSGQPGINSQEYSCFQFKIPAKDEQDKISSFLIKIDTRIETQSKIIEGLETLIKGLSEKLFNQQLKFKNDNGNAFPDWGKKKLEQLTNNISSGKSKFKSSDAGFYPLYGSTGIIGYSDGFEYQGKKVLIARVGANAGSVYKVDGEYSVTDNTLFLDLIEVAHTEFIYYFCINYNLNRLVFGSGQPLITAGQLKALVVTIPDRPEQVLIERFLGKVYEKLKNEKIILKLYQIQKRYLLKNLFI